MTGRSGWILGRFFIYGMQDGGLLIGASEKHLIRRAIGALGTEIVGRPSANLALVYSQLAADLNTLHRCLNFWTHSNPDEFYSTAYCQVSLPSHSYPVFSC